MKRFLIIPFVLLSFFSFSIHARSSIDVPLNNQAYHLIDLLVSHGLVHSAIKGHKPWSRAEFDRLTKEARGRFESLKETKDISQKKENWIEEVISKLEKEFGNDDENFSFHPISKADLVANYLENPRRYFPVSGFFGNIDGFAQPLVQYQEGRDYADGFNLNIETEHWAQISKFTSWYFKPRFQLQIPVDSEAETDARILVQELYGVVNFYNIELQFGRSPMAFGQSDEGGFMLSNNARPLDHFQITNDHPFVLPWVFKYLGLNKWTFFYANMGPDFYFPYTHYLGYKLTLKPHHLLEFSMANELLIGGEGAPEWTWDKLIGDFIGFSTTADGRSNRILGFDGRLTLPFLRGAQLYGEAFFDDVSFNHVKDTLINSTAYKLGFDIPRLNDSGTLYANIEGKYISPRFYRHWQFTGGYTRYDYLLGDSLGPDSWSVSSSIGGFIGLKTIANGKVVFEKIEGDYYLDTDIPEKRIRFLAEAYHSYSHYSLHGKLGYEYVDDYEFISGKTKNNFIAEIGLTLDFDKIIKSRK